MPGTSRRQFYAIECPDYRKQRVAPVFFLHGRNPSQSALYVVETHAWHHLHRRNWIRKKRSRMPDSSDECSSCRLKLPLVSTDHGSRQIKCAKESVRDHSMMQDQGWKSSKTCLFHFSCLLRLRIYREQCEVKFHNWRIAFLPRFEFRNNLIERKNPQWILLAFP